MLLMVALLVQLLTTQKEVLLLPVLLKLATQANIQLLLQLRLRLKVVLLVFKDYFRSEALSLLAQI